VDQERLPEGRTPAGLVLKVDGGGHVNERKADEFGEAVRLPLKLAGPDEMTRPGHGLFHGPEHHGHVGSKSHVMGDTMAFQPFVGGDFVGAEDSPDGLVEDLRRRSRQRAQTGVGQAA
jgi:hypothetical protein